MKKHLLLIASLALLLASCTQQSSDTKVLTLSGLNPNDFVAEIDSIPVQLYTLTNDRGMEVCVTNYGARIVSIVVPDRDGKNTDVVLGHDSLADYRNIDGNFGAAIGRYGNRIEKGKFSLNGKEYQLPINNYGHSLHGGPVGFHHTVWNARQVDDRTLELTHTSPDGDAGYPGNLNVKIVYKVLDDNSLDIAYEATTDAPTIVNLTNHSYFNLGGDLSKNILDQEVMIAADAVTPIDTTFMTHNEVMKVEGTPMDFRQAKPVGRDIDADFEQLRNGHGYDHNYVLNTGGDISKVAASAFSPATGILMEIFTTEPGIQFYVGNFLDGKVTGKQGIAYPYRGALVFETQHFPNSPNCPAYPPTTLNPGETYQSHTIYRFSTK